MNIGYLIVSLCCFGSSIAIAIILTFILIRESKPKKKSEPARDLIIGDTDYK